MLRALMMKFSLTAVVCSISLSAYAIADTQLSINVPAGDLLSALQSLARQADVELVYQTGILKGLHTRGVSGTLSAQDAVRKLLEGTPLQVRTDAATGAMVISPPPASAPAKSNATTDSNATTGMAREGAKDS